MTRIAVTIATAGRPKMLAECLRSVIAQAPPQGTEVAVIVIDNNREPTVGGIVGEVAAASSIPLRVVHEPEPGIPLARNRGIDEALRDGADWIVLIDDDEVAEPGWLATLIAAAEAHKADVVQGKLVKVYPARMPWFVVPGNHSPREEGREMTVAYSHNVAFARWLVDPAKGALRFDEALRYTGGSDSRFFRAAKQIGAKIVATDKSVVTEIQTPERLSLGWQLRREFRVGAGMARTEQALALPRRERKRTPLQLAYRILRSVAILVLSPLALLAGVARFERTVAGALGTIAASIGGFAGLFGWLPDPYRKLDGY